MISKEELEKLLNIANNLLDDYCEMYDEYVLDTNEIEDIEDEDERESAEWLKETNDFLMSISNKIKGGK